MKKCISVPGILTYNTSSVIKCALLNWPSSLICFRKWFAHYSLFFILVIILEMVNLLVSKVYFTLFVPA